MVSSVTALSSSNGVANLTVPAQDDSFGFMETAPSERRDIEVVLKQAAKLFGKPVKALEADPQFFPVVRIVNEMDADGGDRSQPVRSILARVGDRWSPVLIQLLEPGPMRFSLLLRLVTTVVGESISKQILSTKLHALERDGFVRRTDLGGARPVVEYSLTPTGLEFAGRIKDLISWGRSVIPQVRAAREDYEGDSRRW